jgi:AcrR family transcriptional regulator
VSHQPSEPAAATRPRRADAQRSIERIIDAAVDCLSVSPEASMVDIARRAGVVRATIYVHFPTRESLIDAVTRHAMTEVTQVVDTAEPEAGEPVDALRRVLAATWRTLGRYHALVAINTRLPHEQVHERHGSVLARLEPLVVRGQAAGAFRADVPVSWHLATMLALIHSASAEVRAGRIAEDQVQAALVDTVVAAVSATRA